MALKLIHTIRSDGYSVSINPLRVRFVGKNVEGTAHINFDNEFGFDIETTYERFIEEFENATAIYDLIPDAATLDPTPSPPLGSI